MKQRCNCCLGNGMIMGMGMIAKHDCKNCNGSGYVEMPSREELYSDLVASDEIADKIIEPSRKVGRPKKKDI